MTNNKNLIPLRKMKIKQYLELGDAIVPLFKQFHYDIEVVNPVLELNPTINRKLIIM